MDLFFTQQSDLCSSDEDECVSLPGVCGSARCENVQGSFMCECDRAGEEFDPRAKKCLSTAPKGQIRNKKLLLNLTCTNAAEKSDTVFKLGH